MDYFEEINLLVLYGGRDDKRNPFNDIWMMDLERFVWLKVNIYDYIPAERSEHSSCILGNKLIIFGGMNKNNYVGADIYEICLGSLIPINLHINIFFRLL